MTASTFLTNIVVPAATALTGLATLGLTALFFTKGEIGPGVCTLALTAAIALFVVHDVKRLLLK